MLFCSCCCREIGAADSLWLLTVKRGLVVVVVVVHEGCLGLRVLRLFELLVVVVVVEGASMLVGLATGFLSEFGLLLV